MVDHVYVLSSPPSVASRVPCSFFLPPYLSGEFFAFSCFNGALTFVCCSNGLFFSPAASSRVR